MSETANEETKEKPNAIITDDNISDDVKIRIEGNGIVCPNCKKSFTSGMQGCPYCWTLYLDRQSVILDELNKGAFTEDHPEYGKGVNIEKAKQALKYIKLSNNRGKDAT